jgi:excisionase family DNA binding protein
MPPNPLPLPHVAPDGVPVPATKLVAHLNDRPEAQAPQLLLTTHAAAAALSVSERTLWTLTHPRGPIPAVRIGRSVRYPVDALRAWIAAQQRGGESLATKIRHGR